MKKLIITSAVALIVTGSAFAQPVSDRAVIPLGVTLQQILRIHVVNGGNIEFVFNDITDYNTGITNAQGDGFYDTDVTVASSTDWDLHMGAEDATLIGTDNPANTLALNNVGVTLVWTGVGGPSCCAAANDITMGLGYPTIAGVNDLVAYTGVIATDGLLIDNGAATGSGGTTAELAFTLNWECGTMAAGMNASSILAQSPTPDRYITNVFLDLVSN